MKNEIELVCPVLGFACVLVPLNELNFKVRLGFVGHSLPILLFG